MYTVVVLQCYEGADHWIAWDYNFSSPVEICKYI